MRYEELMNCGFFGWRDRFTKLLFGLLAIFLSKEAFEPKSVLVVIGFESINAITTKA
jgi:hypothetical protein